MHHGTWTPCVFAALLHAAALSAQDTGPAVTLHGFGSWSYGRTSHNLYLAGNPDGDFHHAAMAINLTARVNDKLTVHAQAEMRGEHVGEHVGEAHTTLSFAFAAYRLSDGLSFRIGQVKLPSGLYTEVFSVGTLRPFLELPQAYYGPVGLVGESYKGVGILGAFNNNQWRMAYDIFAGGMDLRVFAIQEEFFHGEASEIESQGMELQSTRNVIGGRVVVSTPIVGLNFGISAHTGILDERSSQRRTTSSAQVSYRTNALTLEGEIGHEVQVGDERSTGGYVLAAYRITPTWQVAVQRGALKNTFFGVDPGAAPSLQHHRDAAVGLSYWLSRSLVLKTEFHAVSGNRFATPLPEELADVIAAGHLRTKTHLFQFGGQFSF